MPSPLLSAADYPSIRAAINVDFDEVNIPDNIIAMPIYSGAGMNMVLFRDPLAESRTGAQEIRVVNAAILFTASLLAEAILPVVSEKEGDITLMYSRKQADAIAENLRKRAEDELDAVLLTVGERPTMFTTVGGRRGL